MQRLPGKILSFLAVALLTLLAILGIRSAIATSTQSTTQTVGWAENVRITNVEADLKAKFDTGATTTSLNAEILEKPDADVESGGLVKFNFIDTNGRKTLFERPLQRWVKIVGDDQRPVVQMNLCLAGKWLEDEVNLTDRSDFDYAILVGRNMLKEAKLAVDSSQTFTIQQSTQKDCAQETKS